MKHLYQLLLHRFNKIESPESEAAISSYAFMSGFESAA